MKKIISLVLAMLLCFALASCGEKDPDLYEGYENSFTNGGNNAIDTEYTEFPTGPKK